ncbi:ABC transporter ATP-binding protein [Macrococcus animalis]|uniref:ABC transporter ATP-binding protein n=1 Tax=Macrococcus animalis TaxID=3395467 RepID=UPI0039BE4895
MIEFKNVKMKFNETVAVNNLNLTINSGEFISILGPSGCGKSTTLMMLAGLYQPISGQIIIDGKDMTITSPASRNIGMVFQDYALYPHMTLYNNIAFPLKMMKISKKEIKEKVECAARLVKIDHLLERLPNQLSGGQQQRVAIARAIVREPDILLLDEPLSNLDAKLRASMREEIRELQQRLNITTVFVTHDQEEALSISDKVIMLNEGSVMQYDSPNVIYQQPNNIFVASFIGNPPMNLLKINQEEINQFDCGIRLLDGQIIGIRPEHIILSNQGYPAYVKRIEQFGKDTLVTVEDSNRASIKFYTTRNLEKGELVYLTALKENITRFNTQGERL